MGCGGGEKRKAKSRERNVPLDVISDILSRLPTRSAARFGCVSRPWRELVTQDRYFQQEQYRRSLAEAPHIAALSREDKGCITFNLSRGSFVPPPDLAFGHIRSSRPLAFRNACNGVLCFVAPLDGSVLLCNPITGQLLTLPEFSTTCTPPSKKQRKHSAALGFTPSTNEYKVVRLSHAHDGHDDDDDDDDDDDSAVIAEVYSLDSPNSRWRRVHCGAPYPPDRKIFYCQGKLHWIHRNRIVTFDVAREEFTGTPPGDQDFGQQAVLLELSGRLSLVRFSPTKVDIEVWILEDTCWHKVCDLHVPEFFVDLFNPKLSRLLNMWERGGSLLLRLQDRWVSYDLKTKKQKALGLMIMKFDTPDYDWEICHGYRASLVSFKADGCGNNSSGWASFNRDLGPPCWVLRLSIGLVLETMDMAARLHPEHESIWTKSYLATKEYFDQIQADIHSDRRTIGPHIYPTAEEAEPSPSKEEVNIPNGFDLFEYQKLWWW